MNELGRIRAITATTAAAQRHVQQFIQGQAATGSASAIASQRQRLEKALASQDAAGKPSLLKDEAANCAEPETTALTGKVTSRSGADSGSFKFTLPNGHQVDASLYFAAFQVDSLVYSVDDSTNPPVVSLLMIGADANAGYTPYVLQVFIESPQFKDGSQRLHGFATNAMLFSVDKNNPKDIRALALGATGAITLEGTSGFASKNGTGGNLDVTFDLSLEYVPTAIGARSAN